MLLPPPAAVEKINEMPRINLASQNSPNITIKADKNLTLGCTVFAKSTYTENWALLYEALSMLTTKKKWCSQRKLYFSFNPQQEVLEHI